LKILLVGAGGQLGSELQVTRPEGVDLVAATRTDLDVTRREDVLEFVADCMPAVIINAAAYTAVDGAEAKPDLAVEVNAEAVGHLARAAERCGSRLLQVSTDLVFYGQAGAPYLPQHEPRPLNVLGHSKLAGECRAREILPTSSLVLRTSWPYSRFGSNFVLTMLRLMAEREELRVVNDQVFAPTWARSLANTIWLLLGQPSARGIYHWTDAGRCSWYEFAREIQAQALDLGLLDREIPLEAIPTSDYPTQARRPLFTVLDLNSTEKLVGGKAAPWQEQLRAMLEDLRAQPGAAGE
jgi:dTDP-4-dehydrorhamnose reductase